MSDPLSMTQTQVEALPEKEAAAVLSAWVKARRAELPESLAGSSSKVHARLARKALYQLRSSGLGVEVPRPAAETVAPIAEAKEDEFPAVVTPPLGTGERALLFARPLRGGGVEMFQAIVSDEFGVAKLDAAQANRSLYRGRIKELRSHPDVAVALVPFSSVIAELGRALTLNDRTKNTPSPEMTDIVRRLEVEPLDPEWPIPPLESGDAAAAEQSAGLHDQPEIKQWMPPEQELAALGKEPATDPAEQTRRATEAATRFFTTPMRRIWARRLWQTAEVFDFMERPEPASLARATARHLFHASGLSPFQVRFFSKVFELAPQQKRIEELLAQTASPRLPSPTAR